jgi:steroid delta-isomerase-like uncharacterized protein
VITAFNGADWAQLRSIFAPHVVYTETETQRHIENLEGYLQLLQGWKQALPDAQGIVHNAVSQDNTAVLELTWAGTQTGPLQTPNGILPVSGKAIRVPAAAWFTFDGEMVQEVHHYLDVLTLLQQLGALPG